MRRTSQISGPKARAGGRRRSSGFSMVEMLVAIGVVLVTTLAGFVTQVQSFDLIDSSRDSTVAVTDLEVCVEEIISFSADAIPGEFQTGVPIAAYTGLHLPNQQIVPTYPNYAGVGQVPDTLEITLTMTWDDRRGRPQRLTVTTAKSR